MSHEEFQSCIDACLQCATDCIHCENACLDEKNVNDLVRCIRLDRECADICLLTAKMLAGNTEFSKEISMMCANICEACAEECQNHAQHMDHCRICAESCSKCAEECKAIARVHVM